MQLSIRLRSLAEYYHHVEEVWDIGCDHGLLGLSFHQNPQVKSIHLVDPSAEVIRTLHKKVVDSYITNSKKIKIHHSKGQDLKLAQESKIIFIAGMGGKEIGEILKHLLPQLTPSDRVVISPHRNILELRAYLEHSEYRLCEEKSLEEEGQFYQILCLDLTSDLHVSAYGDQIWEGKVGEEYASKQMKAFEKHQDKLSRAFFTYLKTRFC